MCIVTGIFFIIFLVIIALILERRYRKPRINDIISKSVFITGTDSGIGHLLALHLDKKGVKVYAGCYTEQGADVLKKAASSRLKVIKIDVTKIESILLAKKFIEEDLKPEEGLWGLVNNAGILRGLAFCLSTLDDYRSVMEVNFFGTINVTEVFSPLIRKSGGRIVNVISICDRASCCMEPYSCSKSALQSYNDGLRRWMKRYNVHVAAIEPGMIPGTNLFTNPEFERSMNASFENAPQYVKDEFGDQVLNECKQRLIKAFKTPPAVLRKANHPKFATISIYHALFAKHPKDRYVCGFDARLFYRWISYFPDWLLDFFFKVTFSKYFKIW